MMEKYFDVDEKLGFWEDFLFDHALIKDEMLVKRTGVSLNAIILGLLAFICIILAL